MENSRANLFSHVGMWIAIVAGLPGCMWILKPYVVWAGDIKPIQQDLQLLKSEFRGMNASILSMRADQLSSRIYQLNQVPESSRGEMWHIQMNKAVTRLSSVNTQLEAQLNE